jgi:hypothetical protein
VSARRTANAASGALRRKSHRHDSAVATKPATSGPTAEPIAPVALQMPIAVPRRSGGNASLTIDSEVAVTNAAPSPCTARAAINTPVPGARPAISEPTANTAAPMVITRRRPNRSPSRPAATSGAASASMYAFTIHSRVPFDPPRSRPMTGSTTVSPRKSSAMTTFATDIAATVAHPPPFRSRIR